MRRLLRIAAFTATFVGTGAFALAPAQANAPAPKPAVARFEVDFLTGMIDHHAMAVHMAEMCVEKAVHPQLRSLCRDIVSSQSTEIAQMQRWLQNWYGINHEPVMSPEHMMMMDQLEAAKGVRFDKLFLKMMIEHHLMAVDEATACLRTAYHPQLLQLCSNIVANQAREVAQMQVWLRQWFGNSNPTLMSDAA